MDKTQRGQAAQALLESPLLKEILSGLDAEYHACWRDAKTAESREDLFRYVKVLERISSDILQIAVTGKLEKVRQDELEANKKRGLLLWPTK